MGDLLIVLMPGQRKRTISVARVHQPTGWLPARSGSPLPSQRGDLFEKRGELADARAGYSLKCSGHASWGATEDPNHETDPLYFQ